MIAAERAKLAATAEAWDAAAARAPAAIVVEGTIGSCATKINGTFVRVPRLRAPGDAPAPRRLTFYLVANLGTLWSKRP